MTGEPHPHSVLLTLTPQLLARIQALGFDGSPSDALAWLVSCAEDHAETVLGFDVYRDYTTTALGIDPRSCPEDVAEAVATFQQVARLSAAWNEGASAQCDGLPRNAVPYLPDSEEGAAWLAGWTADAWSPGGRLHREMAETAKEMRLTLAAEQGRPEGAPYDNPELVLAMVNGERIRRGLSWRELAAILGVSPSTLTRWTHGKMLSVPAYLRVCKWLNAAINETIDIVDANGPGWCDRCSPDRCDCGDDGTARAAMIAPDKAMEMT